MTCKPTCACQCRQPSCGCLERERPFVPNRVPTDSTTPTDPPRDLEESK